MDDKGNFRYGKNFYYFLWDFIKEDSLRPWRYDSHHMEILKKKGFLRLAATIERAWEIRKGIKKGEPFFRSWVRKGLSLEGIHDHGGDLEGMIHA